MNPKTDLYYYRARYYSPKLGRFLQTDPVGMQDEVGQYVYVRNDPFNRLDPLGDDSIAIRGNIHIRPIDPTVPRVDLQNKVAARGISSYGFRPFHTYNVPTQTKLSGSAGLRELGRELARNPTPGIDKPATRSGTVNDVGPLPLAPGENLVRSFLIPSPDPSRYTDIIVNYTIAGEHGYHEGFVLRFGEIGPSGTITLRSYGEGNAVLQTQGGKWYWEDDVEAVWQGNAGEVVKQVCTGSRIPREQCP
ncbi:MAG TPA: RHS repeat-associated core domain-containing protein [Aestuariivirgaceae bacterium]